MGVIKQECKFILYSETGEFARIFWLILLGARVIMT